MSETPRKTPDHAERDALKNEVKKHLDSLKNDVDARQRAVVEAALKKVPTLKPETIKKCMKTLEEAQKLDEKDPKYSEAMLKLSGEIVSSETMTAQLKEFSEKITTNIKSLMEQLSVLGTEALQQIAELFPNSTIGHICNYVSNTVSAYAVTVQKAFTDAELKLENTFDISKASKYIKSQVDTIKKKASGFKATEYLNALVLKLEKAKTPITLDTIKELGEQLTEKTLKEFPVAQTTPVQPPPATPPVPPAAK